MKIYSKNLLLGQLMTITLILVMSSCTNTKNKSLSEDFEQQKEELVEGLENLEADIDDAIDDVKDKMNIDEGPVERNFEKTMADLEEKKREVKKSMEKAKRATSENWDSVKKESDDLFEEIKVEFGKLQVNIESTIDEKS